MEIVSSGVLTPWIKAWYEARKKAEGTGLGEEQSGSEGASPDGNDVPSYKVGEREAAKLRTASAITLFAPLQSITLRHAIIGGSDKEDEACSKAASSVL